MKDCEDLKINPESIKYMKRERFKGYLKEKISSFSFEYLQKKKMGHSKVKDIDYPNLSIQPYLTDMSFTTAEKQLLFSLRSRCSSSKANFKSMYVDLLCNLCDAGVIQSDIHLLDCVTIINNCPQLAESVSAEHEDIFSSDIKKQQEITRLYSRVFETKKILEGED